MKAIIRNCNHGSGLIVAENLDEHGRTFSFSKSSTTARGIQALRNELKAYQWYNGHLQKKIKINSEQAAHYLRMDIEFIDGKKCLYTNGLLQNKINIERAIQHYVEVWRAPDVQIEFVHSHGDLSLENILFSESSVTFIDWEHFLEKTLPIGFDALYLLFVSLFFEIGNTRKPTEEMLFMIAKNISFLKKSNCLSPSYEDYPLTFLIDHIYQKKEGWNLSGKNLFGRLPILQWSTQKVEGIEKKLSSYKAMWGHE